MRTLSLRPAAVSDLLAMAVAVLLPWSTTATTVAIVLWAVSLVFTLRPADIAAAVRTPYGAFAVALVLVAALGMLYADVSWSERAKGFGPFYKLLCIPLLIAQFQRSERGLWVAGAFLVSCAALLLVSLYLLLWPGLAFRGRDNPGVLVRDYMTQSAAFMLCAFGLLHYAIGAWKSGRTGTAAIAGAGAGVFLGNLAYVLSTGSAPAFLSALAVFVVLSMLLAARLFGARGIAGAALVIAVLAGAVALAVPPVAVRAVTAIEEVQAYRNGKMTYPGLRYEVSKEAARRVAQAPLLGHGTGSISSLYRDFALVKTGALRSAPTNPHQQILAVAVQLGLVGAALLVAMWVAHFALFSAASGLAAWIGLMIVAQNIVASISSSFLFDYTSGWIYAFGVGVAAGTVLRGRAPAPETAGAAAVGMRAAA